MKGTALPSSHIASPPTAVVSCIACNSVVGTQLTTRCHFRHHAEVWAVTSRLIRVWAPPPLPHPPARPRGRDLFFFFFSGNPGQPCVLLTQQHRTHRLPSWLVLVRLDLGIAGVHRYLGRSVASETSHTHESISIVSSYMRRMCGRIDWAMDDDVLLGK